MRKVRYGFPGTPLLLAFALGAVGCDRAPRVTVAEEADAGGIEIRAESTRAADSTRVVVTVINRIDTSADITFNGGCPITLLTVDLEGRVRWDERAAALCESPDIAVPLAPGEVKLLRHAVHADSIPAYSEGETQLAARVLVAADQEYILATDAH